MNACIGKDEKFIVHWRVDCCLASFWGFFSVVRSTKKQWSVPKIVPLAVCLYPPGLCWSVPVSLKIFLAQTCQNHSFLI